MLPLNYLVEYVIRISVVLIAVCHIGFWGIALSYYASNIFGNISRLVKLLKHTGVRFRPFSMAISPILYAFLTMSAADLIFRLFSVKAESIFTMSVYVIIWLGLYGGVYILSHILTPVDFRGRFFVHNRQMSV